MEEQKKEVDKKEAARIKQLIRQDNLVTTFNEVFPVGSSVLFRNCEKHQHRAYTVKSRASLINGKALVRFEEFIGACSIDPLFIIYP